MQGFTPPTPNCSRLLLNLQILLSYETKPRFDDLNNPTILNHVEELKRQKRSNPTRWNITPTYWTVWAVGLLNIRRFPQAEKVKREQLEKAEPREANRQRIYKKQLDKLKLNLKHYLVLSIENALQFAEKNRWGLMQKPDFIYLCIMVLLGWNWQNFPKVFRAKQRTNGRC